MKTKKTFNKNITEDNNMASINGISLKAMKSFEWKIITKKYDMGKCHEAIW